MSKNILILGSRQTSKDPERYYNSYKSLFINGAVQNGLDVEVKNALIDDLVISVGAQEFVVLDAKNEINFKDYDLVFLRGSGFRQIFDVLLAISTYCHRHGVEMVNDYSQTYDFSKLSQTVKLISGGVEVPQSIYVTSAVLSGKYALPFTFPCIMKDVHGAHGNDNYVVETFEQMTEISQSRPKIRFILQPFIPNDGDLRVLLLGEENLIIRRRAEKGSHLNNTSQGGNADLVDSYLVEDKVMLMARKAAKILNMSCAGVDIIMDLDTKQYFVLEVNSQPQIQTGAFLEAKQQLVAEFLKNI